MSTEPGYFHPKASEEVELRVIDWNLSLAPQDTIIGHFWTVRPATLTLGANGRNGSKVFTWISGGTQGTQYFLTCRVVTTQGYTMIERIPINIT